MEVAGIFTNRALAEKKDANESEIAKAQFAVTRELYEKIKEVFGTGALEKLRAFESGTGARQDFVDSLSARLSYSTLSIVAALLSSTLIGVVFGFMPARSAARLDPVQALARE